MSKQLYFQQFSLAQVHSLCQFDPLIGPYQVLPLRARVNLGVMAMMGCSAFLKTPALKKPHLQIQGVLPLCRESVTFITVGNRFSDLGSNPGR